MQGDDEKAQELVNSLQVLQVIGPSVSPALHVEVSNQKAQSVGLGETLQLWKLRHHSSRFACLLGHQMCCTAALNSLQISS